MFVGVRVAPVLAAAALVGVLAGCSGSSDEPRSLPPLSTTPVSTSSPAPPDNKTALSQAEAVVREYFAAKNALPQDPHADRLSALVTGDCSCRSLVRSARHLNKLGRTYFGRATVTHMTSVLDSPTRAEVFVTYNSTAGGTKDARGQMLYRGRPHRGVAQNFYLRRIGNRWLIGNILLVRQGK